MRTATKNSSVTKLDLQNIKQKLNELYANNLPIHVSVHTGRKKLINVPSKITGIYPHFITVVSNIKNYKEENFTINFIDIIIGNFTVLELEEEEV